MLDSLFSKFADIKSEILLDGRLHNEYFSIEKFYLENSFLKQKQSSGGVLRKRCF